MVIELPDQIDIGRIPLGHVHNDPGFVWTRVHVHEQLL